MQEGRLEGHPVCIFFFLDIFPFLVMLMGRKLRYVCHTGGTFIATDISSDSWREVGKMYHLPNLAKLGAVQM